MSISKVTFDGNVLINLENDTVAADKMLAGYTAHNSEGAQITGNIETVEQGEPEITISESGLITATVEQNTGFVDGGTETSSEQLNVNNGGEYTPGTSNQTLALKNDYLLGAIKMRGDTNLRAEFIRRGISIFDVEGSYSPTPTLDTLEVTENGVYTPPEGVDGYDEVNVDVNPELTTATITENGSYTPPEEYYGYSGVVVNVPAPEPELQSKTLTLAANAPGTVTPDTGYDGLSSVSVELDSSVIKAENIAENVTMLGITGTHGGGGGVSFNIAYGDTAPEDTTKLWIKGNEPSAVNITPRIYGSNTIQLAGILPTQLFSIGRASVGTKIYLFGGNTSLASYVSTINCFDTETNTIETLSTTLPTAAGGIACAAVGTKIYLFGGQIASSSYTNTINCFDTETNTIETLSTALPTAAFSIACASVGTKIYLFGGFGSNGYMSTINCFDTESNSITTLSRYIPRASMEIGCEAVGTKIYLFGGYYGNSSTFLSTINCFDSETNTIITLSTTLPIASRGISCGSVGTKIYLFGGQIASSSYTNTINCFDTETNTIETLSTSSLVRGSEISSITIGTKIYLFGGMTGTYSRSSTIQCFTVYSLLTSGDIMIQADTSTNIFQLIADQMEIGVKNVFRGDSDNVAQLEEAYLYKNDTWAQI